MTLKFKDDEEMAVSFLDLLEIVINLREKTKDWQEHYGHERTLKRKKWEEKADEYLSNLQRLKKIQ